MIVTIYCRKVIMTEVGRFLMLAVASVAMIGCAAVGGQALPGNFRVIVGQALDPVEQDIVERHRRISQLNASLGDDERTIILDESDRLLVMSAIIAPRFARDLQDIYGDDADAQVLAYLAQVESSNGQKAVFVTRVQVFELSGTYSTLPGLIYLFDVAGREILSVQPTNY